MATTFIEGIGIRPGRTAFITVTDSIDYIINPAKTRGGELVTGFACSPETAALEIMVQQKEFEQDTDRKIIRNYDGQKNSYLLMTMRQSFAPGEVDADTAHKIGCEFARRVLGTKYQYVVATHINSHCIHNHITFNIIGSDYKKFRQTKYTHRHISDISDKLCQEYGLEVVVPSKDKRQRGYTGEKETPFRTVMRHDIDKNIKAAKTFEDFLERMRQNYYIRITGKYLSFRHKTNGQKKNFRSYSLGEDYTEENIRSRILLRDSYVPFELRNQSKEEQPKEPAVLSFSQKKRNIEAMLRANGVIAEYGIKDFGDFKKQADVIQQKATAVQEQLQDIQNKTAQLNGFLKCFEVIDQYKEVEKEYQQALLKERFYQEHRTELDLYREAVDALQNSGLDYKDSETKQKLSGLLDSSMKSFSEVQKKYDALHDSLKRLEKARKVVEKVYGNENILTERKGGKNFDR